MTTELLDSTQADRWRQILGECAAHDFYHLPGYHALAELRGEGAARLFVYRGDAGVIAVPFLLRPLDLVAGLEDEGRGWFDANSVYGYAGPIISHALPPAESIRGFQEALKTTLADLHVVSLFSRLHPLLPQRELLTQLGEVPTSGTTVSIDLTLPLEEQRKQIRAEHRRKAERARDAGLICVEDTERKYLDRFIEIYRQNMERVKATEYYYFDREYFTQLIDALEGGARLFVVLDGEAVAAGGLFVTHGPIAQFHLGGTDAEYLSVAPSKLLVDHARIQFTGEGRTALHLGGGLGGREDSLFMFKSGFSNRRHEFSVWRWILDAERYEKLSAARRRWSEREGSSLDGSEFFPLYRATPVAPPSGPASTTGTITMFTTDQANEWRGVLARMAVHDVYHLPEYHALAESRGEGTARLFSWTEGKISIALPLLLRPLKGLPGMEADTTGWQDATSVYGYGGPLASHPEVSVEVVARFQNALREALCAERVVTVFSRLHPLLPQGPILTGLGEIRPNGLTVSIDVSGSLEEQRAQYRRNHRRDLKSLAAQGVSCTREPLAPHLGRFIEIYHATMRRTHATAGYFFDEAYFRELAEAWNGAMELFVCWHQGAIVCGGLFTALGPIAQAHLAGTADEATALAPMKLMYDAAADWARSRGCQALHMGGGLGAQQDALFRFKQGFSDRTHEFTTWRWVVDEKMHAQLCAARARWNDERGLVSGSPDFFPLYRSAGVQPAPVLETATTP